MAAEPPVAKPEASVPLQQSDDPALEQAAGAAVGLGWQMAELYDEPLPAAQAQGDAGRKDRAHADSGQRGEQQADGEHRQGRAKPKSDLPGVSSLTTAETVALRVAQIDRGLALLSERMQEAGVPVPASAALEAAVKNHKPPGEVRKEIRTLHVQLLSALTVADYRLGKAYGLGRALADTCRSSQSEDELKDHLRGGRLENLIAWCEDLKTVLPAHAGQGIADSLRDWRTWADSSERKTAETSDVSAWLHRQGERWRSVLTGEKDPLDLLTPTTYLRAAEDLLADSARLGWGFLRRLWFAMLIATALFVLGLYVLLEGGGNNVVAGLASIATSLGISWKTATPALTNLATKLGTPLWGAELDAAITVAITEPTVCPLPAGRFSPRRATPPAQGSTAAGTGADSGSTGLTPD
jgi:hypothetical protein